MSFIKKFLQIFFLIEFENEIIDDDIFNSISNIFEYKPFEHNFERWKILFILDLKLFQNKIYRNLDLVNLIDFPSSLDIYNRKKKFISNYTDLKRESKSSKNYNFLSEETSLKNGKSLKSINFDDYYEILDYFTDKRDKAIEKLDSYICKKFHNKGLTILTVMTKLINQILYLNESDYFQDLIYLKPIEIYNNKKFLDILEIILGNHYFSITKKQYKNQEAFILDHKNIILGIEDILIKIDKIIKEDI